MRLRHALALFPLLLGSVHAQDLVARTLVVPSTVPRGTLFAYSLTWQNASSVATGLYKTGLFVSADSTITSSDQLIWWGAFSSLGGGQSRSFNARVTMPRLTPIRTHYVGFFVDYEARVRETNESNNTLSKRVQVIAGPNDLADLVIASVSRSSSSLFPLQTFTATATVRNIGPGTARPSWTGFYVSNDATITTRDLLLAQATTPSLLTGRLVTLRAQTRVPTTVAPGSRFLGAFADRTNLVPEPNNLNNGRATPITVLGRADMRADLLTINRTSQIAGGPVRVTYRVSNQGNLTTPSSTLDILLDSATSVRNGSIILARIAVPALGPRATRSATVDVEIPHYLAPSSGYKIWLFADSTYRVTELSEANNIIARPLQVTEYQGAPLQLEFQALRGTAASSVTRTSVVISASRGGSVGMALKSRPLASHWVLTSWGLAKSFTFDATTDFSLSILNSPIFPLWFSRLDSVGRQFPSFRLPRVSLSSALRVYGRTYALKPDFSGISGTAGFVRFDLTR